MKPIPALVAVLPLIVFVGLASGQRSQRRASKKSKQSKQAKKQQEPEEEPVQRPTHFKSLTKIRDGSLIRKKGRRRVNTDVRGEWQLRWDHELWVHYERLAQLDHIALLAAEAKRAKITERVEEIRRQEHERYRLSMVFLRRTLRDRLWEGAP